MKYDVRFWACIVRVLTCFSVVYLSGQTVYTALFRTYTRGNTYIYMLPNKEKGYSARDLVISESCRAEN